MARQPSGRTPQMGATAVEFAIVVMLFLVVLFGIIEFGRLFYVANTVQEVTRRAAREQVVKWIDQVPTVQNGAVFRSGNADVSLPASGSVTSRRVSITFYGSLQDAWEAEDPIENAGLSAEDNIRNCMANNDKCIKFVRASLESDAGAIDYDPLIPLFRFLEIPLPQSTVVMPAEAMGLK